MFEHLTYEKVVSEIANSCGRQAVIVIVIVACMYKFENKYVFSFNYSLFIIRTTYVTNMFLVGLINELLYKRCRNVKS